MALNSSQNKFAYSKKQDDIDDVLTNGTDGSSQDLSEFRSRSRSFRKKNSRRILHNARRHSCGRTVSSLPLVPIVSTTVPAGKSSMAAYFRGQSLRYPVRFPNWDIEAKLQFQNPLYEIPLQSVAIPIISPQMLPPVCPYPRGYIHPPPAIAPMVLVHTAVLVDELPAVTNSPNMYSPEQIVPNVCEGHYSLESAENPPFNETAEVTRSAIDHLEFYLSLPKEIFPNAMMLSLDPNPIIDEFCKYNAVLDHSPWILDLEFGVPREATTRTIAMYDVKYNSIQCKNTPNAIHPGFESCDPTFKSVLMFYYDCVISMWYRGYIILNQDNSVENFQSWLCPPMQEFGMCWP